MRLNLINQATASLANVVGVGPAGPAGANGAQGPAGSGEIVTIASTVSASGALSASKHNPVDASGGVRTMTLPTGMAAGTTLTVEKEDASSNAVTITGNIRGVGSSSLSLVLRYESVTFKADASGSWWPVSGHKTKSSLDATYVASDAVVSTVTTSSAGMAFNKKVSNPGVGTTGVLWRVAGVDKWSIGMDVGERQMALLYDSVGSGIGAATSADVIRVEPGAYFQIARSAGPASKAHRLHLITDSLDDPTNSDVLYLQVASGAPTNWFVKGQNNGVETFGVNKTGAGYFGLLPGTSAAAFLDVNQGAVIKSSLAGQGAFLMLATANQTVNRAWLMAISTTDGTLKITDNTTGLSPFFVQAGAAANTVAIGSTYAWLGAAGSTVGFYGVTGQAKSTGWTTMTGTATKAAAGFDTSTVTLPQLAQVVKALLDRGLGMNLISA